MIITFSELGIKSSDYTAQSYAQAFPLIIDKACDYIMYNHFCGRDENECIPDPCGGFVNFILQTVTLDTAIPDLH